MIQKNGLGFLVILVISVILSVSFVIAGIPPLRTSVVMQTVPVDVIWTADGVSTYRMDVMFDASTYPEQISGLQWTINFLDYIVFDSVALPSPEDSFFGNLPLDPISDPSTSPFWQVTSTSVSGVVAVNDIPNAPVGASGIAASYWFTVDTSATPGPQAFSVGFSELAIYDPTFTLCGREICAGDPESIENFPFEIVLVNSPPVLDPIGNQKINENALLSIQLTAMDSELDTLIFGTDAGDVLPSGSDFSFDSATGLFTWTPTFDDAGSYLVTFSVSDGEFVDEETITITVNNVNRPPVLGFIGNQVAKVGRAFYLDIDAVDPDDDTLTYYTNALQILPQPVRFSSLSGVLTWMPSNNACKNKYKVTFGVTDGDLSDGETIAIFVQPSCQCSNPGSLLAYYQCMQQHCSGFPPFTSNFPLGNNNCRFPLHISPAQLP